MTVTTCASMGAMPPAVAAGGPTPTIDQGFAGQSLVEQLRALTQQLTALVAALAPVSGALQGAAPVSTPTVLPSSAPVGADGGIEAAGAGAIEQTRERKRASSKQKSSKIEAAPPQQMQRSTKPAADTPKVAAKEFDLPRKNPRSVDEAIAWAKQQATSPSKSWARLCLSFVAHAYGWNASGVPYAIDHYRTAPASMRHDGDKNPPPGALMYWETGSRAGHVALYLGNGMVASNDIRQSGKISIVPVDEISNKWGAKYVGWQQPYFPKGG